MEQYIREVIPDRVEAANRVVEGIGRHGKRTIEKFNHLESGLNGSRTAAIVGREQRGNGRYMLDGRISHNDRFIIVGKSIPKAVGVGKTHKNGQQAKRYPGRGRPRRS